MKELIKKQHEECRKAYESLEDKASAAGLQLLGAMGAYEKLCPELKEDDDEKRMNHIIQFLEDEDRWKDTERAFPIEEDIRWLKDLKSQNRWKPTAAQIYALKEKVNEGIYSGRCSELSSLYHDLMKLL